MSDTTPAKVRTTDVRQLMAERNMIEQKESAVQNEINDLKLRRSASRSDKRLPISEKQQVEVTSQKQQKQQNQHEVTLRELQETKQTIAALMQERDQYKTKEQQMKDTIYQQSRALQNPRPGLSYVTPQAHGPVSQIQHLSHQGPSAPHAHRAFTNPAPAGQSYHKTSHMMSSPEALTGTKSSVGDATRHKSLSSNPMPTSSSNSLIMTKNIEQLNQTSVTPVSSPTPSAAALSSTKLMESLSPTPNLSVGRRMNILFELVRRYAHSHINVPPTRQADIPSQETAHRLAKAAPPRSIKSLLSNPETRFMLIAKMMNQWIIKHVFVPTVFKGMDTLIGNGIETQCRMLFDDTPDAVRYMSANTIANQLRMLQGNDNFTNFFMHVARQNGNLLYDIITPFRHGGSARPWDDMYELMQSAHRLAMAMFTSGVEYRFEFPEVDDVYTTEEMKSRNAQPLPIGVIQSFVSLSVSPRVIVRSYEAGGNTIKDSQLRKADVLVKAKKA